jgi:hypothetical protein
MGMVRNGQLYICMYLNDLDRLRHLWIASDNTFGCGIHRNISINKKYDIYTMSHLEMISVQSGDEKLVGGNLAFFNKTAVSIISYYFIYIIR